MFTKNWAVSPCTETTMQAILIVEKACWTKVHEKKTQKSPKKIMKRIKLGRTIKLKHQQLWKKKKRKKGTGVHRLYRLCSHIIYSIAFIYLKRFAILRFFNNNHFQQCPSFFLHILLNICFNIHSGTCIRFHLNFAFLRYPYISSVLYTFFLNLCTEYT